MLHNRSPLFVIITIVCMLLFLAACNPKEEKPAATQSDAQPSMAQPPPAQQPPPAAEPGSAVPVNLVVDVDGHKMTQEQLDAELSKRLLVMKDQIPKDRQQQVKSNMKKRLIDDFVIRNLLT
ncbi:MAG: hypothetical protein NTZ57_08265, partial [Deltaproteobacteria bacterium]|nr:hypothetical protein [Deltaproteobacteria bacterium]